MSLINEALKKAQRLRTDAPGEGPPSATPAGTRLIRSPAGSPPRPGRSKLPLIAGGATLLVAGLIVGVVLLESGPPPPPPKAAASKPVPPPAAVTTPSVSLPPIPVPAASNPPAPPPAAPAPVVSLPPISSHGPAPGPAGVVTLPTSPAPTPPATGPAAVTVPGAEASPVPSPPVPPKPNPQIYALLDALHVTGIRTSDTDPKVLMNDRVFKLNDVVDRPTGLRITRITADRLTFTDSAGFEYVKTF